MALSVSETTGYERQVFYGALKEAVCPQDHAGRLALWYRPETVPSVLRNSLCMSRSGAAVGGQLPP